MSETGATGLGMRQQAHFESLHDVYERHQYHPSVMEYRRRFIYEPMFRGVDLEGARVVELCSGSGHNSLYVKNMFPGASVSGLDISRSACVDYEAIVGAPCKLIDLTKPIEGASEVFDVAFVVGGLHHCVADIEAVLFNIARLLKPGGRLLMMEPSSEFILDPVRRLWYRLDKRMFDARTERALDHDDLLAVAKDNFRVESVKFFGGPGCAFILNGMIFRIPLRVKSLTTPVLLKAEEAWNLLPWRACHFLFLARWRRI
jgi:ubiquinone/menaquinone biosynthesis C-methylase UbiE